MNFESVREKMGYQPMLLGIFALLANGALAWASSATGAAIAAAEAKDLRDSLSEVLPGTTPHPPRADTEIEADFDNMPV